MQLHELEIGRLAYQAKVNSVTKYKLSSSSERALGLPIECITSIAADVINNNNSSSSAAVFCHECSSSEDSAESDAEQRGGDNSRHRSREKELKDYAYSKALVDFKVVYYMLPAPPRYYNLYNQFLSSVPPCHYH